MNQLCEKSGAAIFLVLALLCCTSKEKLASFEPKATKSKEEIIEVPGFVRAVSQQLVYPVTGLSWMFKIDYLIDEGKMVKSGVELVRFSGEEDQKRLSTSEETADRVKLDAASAQSQTLETQNSLIKELQDLKNERAISSLSKGGQSETLQWIVSARERTMAKMDDKILDLKINLLEMKIKRQGSLLNSVIKVGEQQVILWNEEIKKIQSIMDRNNKKAEQDGVIVYKNSPWDRKRPQLGSNVYAGSPVMAVYDPTHVFIEAFIPEKNYSELAALKSVKIRTLDGKNTIYPGEITQISQVVMKICDWEQMIAIPDKIAEIRAFKAVIKLESSVQKLKLDDEVRVAFSVPQMSKKG